MEGYSQTLDTFVNLHRTQPLQHSRKNNTNLTSSKEIDSISNSVITKILGEKSVDEFSLSLISNAFRSQYLLPHGNQLAILKKHQAFVINLIEKKKFAAGLEQLFILVQYLNKFLHLKQLGGEYSLEGVIKGVNYSPDAELSYVHLVMSLSFLTFQCLLQYISANLKEVCYGTDELITRDVLKTLGVLFHGDFKTWKKRAVDLGSPNVEKYERNMEKMIKGFLKVFDVLISKNVDLRDCRDLLILVMSENIPGNNKLDNNKNEAHSLTAQIHVKVEQPSHSRYSKESSPDISVEILSQQIHSFLQSPSSAQLQRIKLNKSHMSDDKITKLINWFPLTIDELSFQFVNKVIQAIHSATSIQSSKPRLSKNQLLMLDPFTIFLKESQESSPKHIESMESTLSLLKDIFMQFKQFKRLRNVSNLYFHIGMKFHRAVDLQHSIDVEHFIYLNEQIEDNLLNLTSKSTKVARLFVDWNDLPTAWSVLARLFPVLDSCDNPALIQTLSKCLPRFTNEFVLSIKSEKFMMSLVLQLFKYVERYVVDSTNILNTLVQKLLFADRSLQCVVYYHYYDVNGLADMLDLEVPECDDSMALCGLLLQKLVNIDWNETNLMRCIKIAEIYGRGAFAESGTDAKESFNIYKQLILYLKFNGLTGHNSRLIESFKVPNLTPSQQIFLQTELCISNYSSIPHLHENLNQLNSLLKTLKISSIHKVVNFNVLQLNYLVKTSNFDLACEKFTKILKILKSKPEFNLSNDQRLTDKFTNLILIAKFQIVSSKLNSSLGNHFESFNSIKIAIKLLYSIIKKTTSNIPKSYHNELKWETAHLLFESYSIILTILQKLGITRDLMYYLNEFKKINNSNNIPLINCINYYQMAVYDILLNKEEGTLKKAREYLKYELVRHNAVVLDLDKMVGVLVGQENEMHNKCDIIKADIESTTYNPVIPWAYLFSLKRIKFGDSKNTFVESKFELSSILDNVKDSPYYSQLSQSIKILPTIISEGLIDKSIVKLDIINNLLKCNQMLLSFTSTKTLSYFNLYEIRDLNLLLNHCLSLISSMTIFKLNTSLLVDLYYLQDFANTLPFMNDRLLNHGSSGLDDLLPPDVKKSKPDLEEFSKLSVNFNIDLNLYLPDNWSIVSIDICPSGDLIMSKFIKGAQPFFIRLPMKRYTTRGGKVIKGFEDVQLEFKEIICQSDLSTKTSTTSKIHTKEDRKKWWKLRFSLDLQLKDLLDHVEQYWFGGFKCLFNNYKNDMLFFKFKLDMLKLIKSILPSRKNSQMTYMEFDENLFEAFYNLQSYNREEVDDLIYYVVNQLAFHGEKNNYDEINFEKFHKSVAFLFDKYFNLREQAKKNHLVLIPSSKCAFIPWESLQCMQNKSISRMPSVHLLVELLKSRPELSVRNEKLYYMINPSGDLKRTEEKFKKPFQDEPRWSGLVGEKPIDDSIFLENLLKTDLFVYLGHGGCDQYVRTSTLYKRCLPNGPKLPPSLLIGCSLGALQTNGILEPSGNIYNWLTCGSPMVLVNLWDVTDKDIDQFSMSIFDHWGLHKKSGKLNICEATYRSRLSCNLVYLNGAAPVVYGLPLYIGDA